MSSSSNKKRGGPYNTSSSQMVLKRSAQECGLDQTTLRTHFTRPLLFPDLQWHSNGSLWKIIQEEQDDGDVKDEEDGVVNKAAVASTSATAAPAPAIKMEHPTSATHIDTTSTSSLQQQPTVTKRPASTVYLIQKGREMHLRMQTSPQYYNNNGGGVDRMRIRARVHSTTKNAQDNSNKGHHFNSQTRSLLHYYYGSSNTDDAFLERYFPSELIRDGRTNTSKKNAPQKQQQASSPTSTSKSSSTNKRASLEEWEARESSLERTKRLKRTTSTNEEQQQDWDEQDEDNEDDIEQEAEDYTTNYYESEGDDDGSVTNGGEKEPTF